MDPLEEGFPRPGIPASLNHGFRPFMLCGEKQMRGTGAFLNKCIWVERHGARQGMQTPRSFNQSVHGMVEMLRGKKRPKMERGSRHNSDRDSLD